MKERPILFNAPMVRAVLDGSKTQTRRILSPQPAGEIQRHVCGLPINSGGNLLICKHGQPGDRLYVRETWQHSNFPLGPYDADCDVFYRADYMGDPHGPDGELSPEGKYRTWRPSIHMPKIASRILLKIVSVRVERLQDISDADAMAEGVNPAKCVHDYYDGYAKLWAEINGAGSWEANPWVWVVEFKRVTA